MVSVDFEERDDRTTSRVQQEEDSSSNTGGLTPSSEAKTNGEATTDDDDNSEQFFQVTVKLPHEPYEIKLNVASNEQVQDLRTSIIEFPATLQYSCFHLDHDGKRINDFVELSEVEGLAQNPVVKLVETPYTEKEARMHFLRVRDLIGATGDRLEPHFGVSAGSSLLDIVTGAEENGKSAATEKVAKEKVSEVVEAIENYDFGTKASASLAVPQHGDAPPKTVKSLYLSPWNPPPLSLRQRGHLMYLLLTTLEGEQFYITSHVSGFFVNKSSNVKFDPLPKPALKDASAHSLLVLISRLSKQFVAQFKELQEFTGRRDPLINFPITNALPASPWVVSTQDAGTQSHQSDPCRTQELWLSAGSETMDNLRDWNEEFQSTKELPKEQVQDRVFRERVTNKLYADYTDAAVRGAMLVARGELGPLNPTEQRDAQIFVHGNIFYSFGVDGMSTFATEGGDEAARVAVGKDVNGVKTVAGLDLDGLFTAGTVVVDYMGRRVVGQSIVPGIFKQREPDEHQIDYGGVEGRETVVTNQAFVEPFSKMAKALKIKRHDVWDKQGEKHTLEASVETKGLLGTDGRKYVLDLYRLNPLDVVWLEKYWTDIADGEEKPREKNYPHRMAVLRQELIDDYWRTKVGEYVTEEYEKRKAAAKDRGDGETPNGNTDSDSEATLHAKTDSESDVSPQERIDISKFEQTFNPDVLNGQTPTSEEDKEAFRKDEDEVRTLCKHLQEQVIPLMFRNLINNEIGFPMDGLSLTRLLHKRGINIRYLGHVVEKARTNDKRLETVSALAIQEMIARSFKHIANGYMRALPVVFVPSCLTHLLNCLLGTKINRSPTACVDADMQELYFDAECAFANVTPASLQKEIEEQVYLRFRFNLPDGWMEKIKHLQLLREICLKLGVQLKEKAYVFEQEASNNHLAAPEASSKNKKKKNKTLKEASSNESLASATLVSGSVFEPDDLVNIVPVVKDSTPRSNLAEEALEAGRISIGQEQRQMGLELLFEGMSLHEQIYGVLHPEVARTYHTVSTLFYQLGDKASALELARKAVLVSERTLGLDSSETILSYLNLSLFEHGMEHTELALKYILHALGLWKLIYGDVEKHPDAITTINNAAVMLQSLRRYGSSRRWFEKSHSIAKDLSGPASVTVGTLSFQLSQALALDQNSPGAVRMMQEARNIFKEQLGADNRNTLEAQSWLQQLMQNHQNIAKAAKEQQARRLKMGLGSRPGAATALNGGGPPGVQSALDKLLVGGPSSSSSSSAAAVARHEREEDTRKVEDLVRFLEGGRTPSSTPKKKNKNTPAARRGGRRV